MENDGNENHQNNFIRNLNEFTADDLYYIENDLAFYEKVSLGFLLYGTNKINAHIALQKLIAINNNKNSNSDLLFSYTIINTKTWKNCLIEALSIIKEHRILKKLGFNILELKVMFLPHVPEAVCYIHPILKILYFMCENLIPAESGKLISEINKNNNGKDQLRFYDYSFMEIFLLDWISNSLIDVGTWSGELIGNVQSPELELLLQGLKLCEKIDLKEVISDAILRVSKQKQNIENKNDMLQNPSKNNSAEISAQNNQNCRSNEKDSASTSTASTNFEKAQSCEISLNSRYEIRKESAGIVLIINQENFHMDKNPELNYLLPEKPLKKRIGTEKDAIALRATFRMFHYKDVVIKNDLTHIEMLNVISDFTKRSIFYDSFIVIILTHGIEGQVYGCNSIPVDIKKIQSILASRSLILKPKFLIIQACQGSELQKAKRTHELEFDSPDNESSSLYADMLTSYSTIPGYAAVRHRRKGTWFIQELCEKIDVLGDREHVLDIMTSVVQAVSMKRGYLNECMLPLNTTTLTKKFFLPRRFD